MRIGVARVSTHDQNPEAQYDALRAAGCTKVFTDKASGKLARRPELDKALLVAREGDEIVVTKLDRLGRSLDHLLDLARDLHERSVGLVVLDQGIDTTTAVGRMFFRRKPEPDWHVCGILTVFLLEHGSDFTSAHLEQVMADLRVRPIYSRMPGYAPRGTPDRAGQARLSLTELDTAIGRFIREVYNARPHSETGQAPQACWEAGAFIPRMPDSLERLDLLLTTVATPRKIHTDGIHFLNLRYLDPVLADYVTETATIRYDPRDITEIRVYLRTPGTGAS